MQKPSSNQPSKGVPGTGKEGVGPAEEKKREAAADRKIASLEEEFREMKNNYFRAVADLENYKKRAAKERIEIIAATSERLIRELLEVKDHLELAIDHSHGATDVKPLYEGVTLTLKQMSQFLEKAGVTEINALGEPFNPERHEAIQEEESGEHRPGTVVREYQKGYLFGDRLLRPCRVVVAKEKKS